MEINHATLLSIGFVELPNHRQRYEYHGITGRLNPDNSFQFHGISFKITDLTDLKMFMMMIDHRQDSPVAFTNNLN